MTGFNNINQQEQTRYEKTFKAKVVDNNDPDKKQRIRVTIPGLMEAEDPSMLPWILPVQSMGFGTGTGARGSYGSLYVPPLNAQVLVYLEGGDIYYGQVAGVVPLGEVSLTVLETNYPNRYGWVDPAQNHFYVDTTEGQVQIEILHKSGTKLVIDDKGGITVTGVENSTTTIAGNSSLNVTGNTDIRTSGSTNINTEGSTSITSNGSATISSSSSLSVSGSSVTITGSSNVLVNSSGSVSLKNKLVVS